MTKKTYISARYVHLSTYFAVKGKAVHVVFSGGTNGDDKINGGTFTTSDEELQKAIEKDPRFNKTIMEFVRRPKVNKLDKKKKKPTKSEPKNIIAEEPKNLQQARNYLIQNHNVLMKDIMRGDDIKKKAKELNIVFPNIN